MILPIKLKDLDQRNGQISNFFQKDIQNPRKKVGRQFLIENMKIFCGLEGIYRRDGERIINEKDPEEEAKN